MRIDFYLTTEYSILLLDGTKATPVVTKIKKLNFSIKSLKISIKCFQLTQFSYWRYADIHKMRHTRIKTNTSFLHSKLLLANTHWKCFSMFLCWSHNITPKQPSSAHLIISLIIITHKEKIFCIFSSDQKYSPIKGSSLTAMREEKESISERKIYITHKDEYFNKHLDMKLAALSWEWAALEKRVCLPTYIPYIFVTAKRFDKNIRKKNA